MEDKTTMAAEVNRLYWETDQSVAEISSRLAVSRRALYDAIQPVTAGLSCPVCGAQMFFANRSTKAAGIARCLACGHEREAAAADAVAESAEQDAGAGWTHALRASLSNGRRERVVMIASFAIMGAVVGAIATLLVRRRA